MHNRSQWIVLIFISLLMGGCSALSSSPSQDNSSGSSGNISISNVLQNRDTAQQVAEKFLTAWNNQDIDAMYALLSPQSQEFYPIQVFQNRYTVAHQSLNFSGVRYEFKEIIEQGVTTAIQYDAFIQSSVYGEIEDPNRTIRLVNGEQGWRIAWTPMEILNGLTSTSRIQTDSRFPVRENILDRNGLPLVESNGSIIVLSAVQQDMSNVDDCIIFLARIMLRPIPSMRQLFALYVGETFFTIGEIDRETYLANQQELSNTCAIFETDSGFSKVREYQNRQYYGHGGAAHVTGYVGRVPVEEAQFWESRGYQASDIVGLDGIERAYNEQLAGRAQRFLRIVEPSGATLRELQSASGSPPQSVTLTIDRELQMVATRAFYDAFGYASNNWAIFANGGAGIVMDARNGDILAMSSYPTFDPSMFNPESAYDQDELTRILSDLRAPLRNKAIQEQYAPGSTFKVITTLAAANEGVFGLNEIFNCTLEWSGVQQYGDTLQTRYDWRFTDGLEATGEITISGALTTSCDPFFYEMGAKLYQKSPPTLVNYAQEFGLGSQTDIFPQITEASGSLAVPRSVDVAINDAIGQGDVQATVLQMAQMVVGVVNNGTVYEPRLVKAVGNTETETQIANTVELPAEIYEIVHEAMCDVTTIPNFGTAEFVFGDAEYTVCGKTGTAQSGDDRPPHAWFVAYAPRENPEIVIAVAVPNSREGSEVAAPITRRIMDHYFNAPIKAFPEWWEDEYIPLRTPDEVLAEQAG